MPVWSVFAFLAEHRHQLFPDDMFADLIPSGRGRPSLPGDVATSVLLVSALVGDAIAMLGVLEVEALTAAEGKPANAIALLALVAG